METELFPESKRRSRKKSKARIRKNTLILLSCAIGLVILALISYYIIEQKRIAQEVSAQLALEQAAAAQAEAEKVAFQTLMDSGKIVEGVSIDGIDISGMTAEQARAALSSTVAAYTPAGTMTLKFGNDAYELDLSGITVQLNLEEVLYQAMQIGQSGDYEAAKAEVENVRVNGKNYTLSASYNMDVLDARIAQIAEKINTQPVNASMSVNPDSADDASRILFTDEAPGMTVQTEALTDAVCDAIVSGSGEPVEIPVEATMPELTREFLETQLILRASASTSFKGSTSDRIFNIQKGAGLINGTVLKPGDVFSCNDTLGTRTLKNGWEMAGAYVGGAVDQQPGGGVCQLSSTLYNAVVKSDLEIVYRRNHSMPVSYIKKGLDATINSVGNIIDFKFRNNTAADIIIFSYTSGKSVYFEIYGLPFATDEYDEIRLTSEQVATITPSGEAIETMDPSATPVARQNGSSWQSYKNYYKNGVLIRSEKLAFSTYEAFAGVIVVTPTPDPATVTPDPGMSGGGDGSGIVIMDDGSGSTGSGVGPDGFPFG